MGAGWTRWFRPTLEHHYAATHEAKERRKEVAARKGRVWFKLVAMLDLSYGATYKEGIWPWTPIGPRPQVFDVRPHVEELAEMARFYNG